MSYPVVWLPEAEITFKQNLEYLKAEWPESVRIEFTGRVEKTIKVISENPGLYPFIEKTIRLESVYCINELQFILK